MPRLQRTLLLELLATFALATIVVTFVLFAGLGLQKMDRTQGMEVRYLLALLPALLPMAIAYSLPYAYLLSTALVFGRLVADRELVALRACGVHPRVVVAPVLAVGAVLSVASLLLNGFVVPDAARWTRAQERNLSEVFVGMLAGPERRLSLRGCRVSFSSYEPRTASGGGHVWHDLELDQRTADGELGLKLVAARAVLALEGDRLEIRILGRGWILREEVVGAGATLKPADARVVLDVRESGGAPAPSAWPDRRVTSGSVESAVASASFNDLVDFRGFERKQRDFPLDDLLYVAGRGGLATVPERRAQAELHARLSQSVAPFLFGLVAAAVALLLPARGRRLLPFLLAFLPVLALHVPLSIAGRSLADGGRVPAWAGLWAADAALLVVGSFLLRKAYRR